MLRPIRENYLKIQACIDNMNVPERKVNVADLDFFLSACENLSTLDEYDALFDGIERLRDPEYRAVCRYLCRTDLFFLLAWGLNRKDAMHPWIMARCKEVQETPNGCLDLWAREHYKSTILSFALPIQDILSSHGDEPLEKWSGIEVTNCILSHTRPIAKGFLRQIKREFEANDKLRDLFPDVIWANPHKDAPKWSEDDGIILMRKSNPKESTIEAWGLVEGQPTSKHFNILTYDDVVTQGSVNTPEMIKKTVEAWEMSVNLGSKVTYRRAAGTIYHYNDAYRQFMKRGTMKVRCYPCTDDSTISGNPVLKSKEQIAELYKLMGPRTFASQMLLNPVADDIGSFDEKDVQYHANASADGLNLYLLCDPANQKRKGSDFTVMMVIGLGADHNIYIKDMIRDRLNLTEREEAFTNLHKKWMPIACGYEQVGMQSDIQHIEYVQNQHNYRYKITPLGQSGDKNARIGKLEPLFSAKRIYFPRRCLKTNYQGITEDLTDVFINEEFKAFPVSTHDDMLDTLAMLLHPDFKKLTEFPNQNKQVDIRSFINKAGNL